MADNVLARLLEPVVRWARAKSRVGIAVVGALPGRDAEAWAQPRALPIGIPTDAVAPRQADVLVVVGRISHKLAPFLVRTHAAMAQPATVIVIEMDSPAMPRMYATVADVAAIIPVDVVVRGKPPSPPTLMKALAALDKRARNAGAEARATGRPPTESPPTERPPTESPPTESPSS
jgi:NADH-quinone oxidoreductase subunit B